MCLGLVYRGVMGVDFTHLKKSDSLVWWQVFIRQRALSASAALLLQRAYLLLLQRALSASVALLLLRALSTSAALLLQLALSTTVFFVALV